MMLFLLISLFLYDNEHISNTQCDDTESSKCIEYTSSNLPSITLPDKLAFIDDGTFEECSSLTSITIPSGVTFIGQYEFMNCSSLTSIAIPSNVNSIGNTAFNGCSKLSSVTILGDVNSIDYDAFSDCPELSFFFYQGAISPSYDQPVFLNSDKLEYVNVMYYYQGDNFTGKEIRVKPSDSMIFSNSDKFTHSNYLSESAKFTYSQYFTQTSHFSETSAFLQTTYFSKSAAFSESFPFEPTKLLLLHVSGSYGYIKYEIYGDEMTFTSSGKLEKCDADCPYNEYLSEIKKIVISDEVEIIGKEAFSNFPNLDLLKFLNQ